MIEYTIRNNRDTVIGRIALHDELPRPSWLSFLGRAFFWDDSAGEYLEFRDPGHEHDP